MPEVAARSRGSAVVEFGAGSATKTPILLESIAPALTCPSTSPATISSRAPRELASAFRTAGPGGRRFRAAVRRCPAAVAGLPKLGFFPGSTIGNFVPRSATDLLRQFRELLGTGALLLIGMDRVKPVERLIAAYDDPEGVTARFNLNLLERINRELDGTSRSTPSATRRAGTTSCRASRCTWSPRPRRRVQRRRPALRASPPGVDPHREQPQIRPPRRPPAAAGRRLDPARRMDRRCRRLFASSSPRRSRTASPLDYVIARRRSRLSPLHACSRSSNPRPAAERPVVDHHHPGGPELAVRLQRAQHQLVGACGASSRRSTGSPSRSTGRSARSARLRRHRLLAAVLLILIQILQILLGGARARPDLPAA
jgi:hypothetical protein